MALKRKFDILLVIVFFLFSMWLMYKSFGYDDVNHRFRIARHQIGDFGLHLSLIRSFSWGDNFPVESPFFPGKPLPYHYYFDLLIGLLERIGLRIDIAFNGVSIALFTALLFLIYKLPQLIFRKSKLLGILSVWLFVFHSNFTFIDFLKEKGLSFSVFRDLWLLPDYLNKGPFDSSLISIFFTLNVYLNQRHLIAAFAMGLGIIYLLLRKLMHSQKISQKTLIFLGLLLGILSRVHTLTFLAVALSILMFFILFRRLRLVFPFFLPAVFIFFFQAKDIMGQDLSHVFWSPGFLSEKPFSIVNFIAFWFLNLGLALILIPFSFFLSSKKQKLIFLSVFPLFVIGNAFQLSFRIDHNHSLFNFFFIFANFYIAYFLLALFKKKTLFRRCIFILFIFLLTISGLIDLMAVKNDFQFYYSDAPSNQFMQWIRENTNKRAIFLSKQEILDPVTLSGRKNYFGHTYYLSVMGYNYQDRSNRAKLYFEATSQDILTMMRKDGINYIVVPQKPVADFTYQVNKVFLDRSLKKAYKDENVIVYQL